MLRSPVFWVTPSFEASVTKNSIIPREKSDPLVLRSAEKKSETKAEGFGVKSVERQVTATWFLERKS